MIVNESTLTTNYNTLTNLISLPKKMVHAHGLHEMADLVLHELCHPSCFNINKAAYFVDNPDFNCFKGVSGFDSSDLTGDYAITWEDPEHFFSHARDAHFNKNIRSIERNSFKNKKMHEEELVEGLVRELGFKNHDFSSWNMRHGNHGLFIYEKKDDSCLLKDHLQNGLYLLSFCPVI